MTNDFPEPFARQYDSHLKHLKLKGLQPKTIDAYARAIRRLGGYFDYRIDALSEACLLYTSRCVEETGCLFQKAKPVTTRSSR